jgi:hypothetical protein
MHRRIYSVNRRVIFSPERFKSSAESLATPDGLPEKMGESESLGKEENDNVNPYENLVT